MKKIVALFTVLTLLACSIPLAFAGGAAWHHSQTRRNAAYKKWLKQEADFWKRFDAEMAEAGAGTGDRDHNGSQWTPKPGTK